MRYYLGTALVLITALTIGCFTWQANKGSTAVEVNPSNYGTGTPVIQPSNAPGYQNGVPFDMRSK